jgi:hypothetical protein
MLCRCAPWDQVTGQRTFSFSVIASQTVEHLSGAQARMKEEGAIQQRVRARFKHPQAMRARAQAAPASCDGL